MNIDDALAQMPITVWDDDEGVLSSGEVAVQRIARVLEAEFERMDARHQSAFATALSQVAIASSRAEAEAGRAFGRDV